MSAQPQPNERQVNHVTPRFSSFTPSPPPPTHPIARFPCPSTLDPQPSPPSTHTQSPVPPLSLICRVSLPPRPHHCKLRLTSSPCACAWRATHDSLAAGFPLMPRQQHQPACAHLLQGLQQLRQQQQQQHLLLLLLLHGSAHVFQH
jgi:hypothetical protein